MSRKGDPWNNAMMESFFGSLKMEWINGPFDTGARESSKSSSTSSCSTTR
ncbi:MAG: integrase core domain-containing protein [Candidatus Sabulitectum sp.]|nr:integrase core domain-containing protein [Candidatus Sabulitectum sp.]